MIFFTSSLLFICHVSFTNDPSLENTTFSSHLRKRSYFFLKACKCLVQGDSGFMAFEVQHY